jgi:uncharacterized membrane protein
MVKRIIVLLVILLCVQFLIAQPADKSSMLDRFRTAIEGDRIPPEVTVGLISMIPIFELRGAIPVGIIGYHLPWWKALAISVVGNILPIFLVLLLLDPACRILRRIPVFNRFLMWMFARTRKKSGSIEKYEALGLIIFVAIPLPGTGAWSGALAAYIFGLPYWKSLICCFLGVLGAGIVVTVLTLLGWVGAAIALLALVILMILPLLQARR